MHYPRQRSTAVTDDSNIYILGSSLKEGQYRVERFCTKTQQVVELASMPKGQQVFKSSICICRSGRTHRIMLIQGQQLYSLMLDRVYNQWEQINANLHELTFIKSGMLSLDDDQSILIFGGESNSSLDTDRTFVLTKVSDGSYTLSESSPLPIGCTPAITSYTLNSHASFYFISNEGQAFRLNKQSMKWSNWH